MEYLDKLGYYEVGGQKYLHKMEAFAAGKSWKQVKFVFNDHHFQKYDWTKEPEPDVSLEEFYRRRAQQIRDQFDYVVLMYSGGPDSQNMLEIFIDNQIPFEEMVCINSYDRTKITEGTIHNADWIYNSRPSLDHWVKNLNLKSRITILDEIELAKNYLRDLQKRGDWQFAFNTSGFASQFIFKLNWIKQVHHIWQKILEGKKVGIVFGSEKPALKVDPQSNRYYTHWFDMGLTDSHLFLREDRDLKHTELKVLFYSSPDNLDIQAKQLHVLRRFMYTFRSDEFYYIPSKNTRMTHSCQSKYNGKELKYDVYHKTIYSKWNPSIITKRGFAMIDKRVQDNWWLEQLDPEETKFWTQCYDKVRKFGLLPMNFSQPIFIE